MMPISIMQTKTLFRLLGSLIPTIVAYIYLSNVSPFEDDGSVNPMAILLATVVILTALLPLLRTFLILFLTPAQSNKLAFTLSFTIVQLLLINSLGLIHVGSLIIVATFNALILWYLSQSFNKD